MIPISEAKNRARQIQIEAEKRRENASQYENIDCPFCADLEKKILKLKTVLKQTANALSNMGLTEKSNEYWTLEADEALKAAEEVL